MRRTCPLLTQSGRAPAEALLEWRYIVYKTAGRLMQTKTTVTRKLNVPAAKAWDAIATIGRLDVWFPTIASCVVEGNGVGAIRRMDLARGGKIVDHIIDIQPGKMRLIYDAWSCRSLLLPTGEQSRF